MVQRIVNRLKDEILIVKRGFFKQIYISIVESVP